MNHNQINKTIAISAGWLDIKPSNMGHTFTGFSPGGDLGSRMEIPNYCGPNINPIMRLITRPSLTYGTMVSLYKYVTLDLVSASEHLDEPKQFSKLPEVNMFRLFCLITKRPDQIALAYIKAMNLYDPTIHE